RPTSVSRDWSSDVCSSDLLVVPLAVELLAQRGRSLRDLMPGAWILAAPLGALAYFAYLQAAFGSFRVFFDTEEHWHREPFSPVRSEERRGGKAGRRRGGRG